MPSAMKSTQRFPARLGPYNCFGNRQSTKIEFSNAACCFSSSSTWKYGLVTSVVNVRYDFLKLSRRRRVPCSESSLERTQRTLSRHNEFSCDESCSGSVHSVVQIPTCHHLLLPENHVQIHGLVHSTLCKWIELCQLGLRRLLFVRVVNKTVQQFSNVFVTVEILSKNLILNSRCRNFNHRHAPNVHLRTFASRMRCLWKHVQCREVGCSHGQCSRHEMNFRSHRRQHNRHNRRNNNKNIRLHHCLLLTSVIGPNLSSNIRMLRDSIRNIVLMITTGLNCRLWTGGKPGVKWSNVSDV